MQIQSPLSNLRQVLSEVKATARISDIFANNEAATRAALIDPVLKALGWDIANPNMVEVEKTATGARADYAIRDFSGIVQVIVEAKSLNQKLSTYDAKTIMYGHAFQVSSVFLTDGSVWQHFTDFQPQGFKPTKTFDLSKQDQDLAEVAAYFVENLDAAKFWPEQPDVDVIAQEVIQLRSDLRDLTQEVARLSTAGPKPPVINPPPVNPALNWTDIGSIITAMGTRPSSLRLPDNTEVNVKSWKDVLIESCKFVLAHNPRVQIPLVDSSGASVDLIRTATPSLGLSFVSVSYNGQDVYVYANYSADKCIKNALYVLSLLPVSYTNPTLAVVYTPNS